MSSISRHLLLRHWIDLHPAHSHAVLLRITSCCTQSLSPRRPGSPLHVFNRYACTRSAHTSAVTQVGQSGARDNKTSQRRSWPRKSSPTFRPDDKIDLHRSSDLLEAAPYKRTDHTVSNTARRSFQRARHSQGREHIPTHKGPRWPTTFRSYAETERIEGLDTLSVQQVFKQSAGSRTVREEAFSIKACRMPFRKPPEELIPLFVQKATKEYETALAQYNKRLETIGSSSPTPPPPKPLPPTIQYRQRNLRLYPETYNSSHPAFRVTFVVSKKLVSKLAVHRNLARKKLSAAVESTFREYARSGYEYLIFAAQKVMTTPQERLIEMMKSAITNPSLYTASTLRVEGKPKAGKRGEHETSGSLLSINLDSKGQETLQTEGVAPILVRWKNNRPPIYKNWWKHAMPNPLGRTHQPMSYLDMFCPESQKALTPFREQRGRIKALRRRKKVKKAMHPKKHQRPRIS